MKRLYYLDKLGWPVELVKGRWFLNFLRILIHTRKYTFKKPYCLITSFEKEKEGRPLDETLRVLQDSPQSVNILLLQKSHGESLVDVGYQSEPDALLVKDIDGGVGVDEIRCNICGKLLSPMQKGEGKRCPTGYLCRICAGVVKGNR